MMKRIMVAILFLVGISFGPGEDLAYGQSYIDSFAAGCNSGNTYNNSFIVVSSDLVVGVGSAPMNVNVKTCRVSYGTGYSGTRNFRMGRVDGGTSDYNGTYFIFVSDGSAGNNACETVPDAYRQYLNCPTPEPTEATPEEKCSQYQNLFDPPSGNCLFQVEYGTKCVDGAGNGIYYEYRVRASDGRTSDWQNSHTSTENEGVECISYESQCNNPEGCWVPSDLDRCVYKDSDGNIKMKPECWVDSSSPPESGWSDLCDMGVVECPPKGGDDGGGGTPGGGGGDDDDGGGGGTPGGGGDNSGGGGTPGGGDDGGGGGTPGGGGDTPGGTGGGGGGTGGGESGTGDDDEDLGSHSGDGGWGEIDGKPGMDKGRDDLEARLDKIFSDIEGSGTFKEIEGHKYITLIEPVCSLEFSLPMLGGSVYYDFCKYRSELELLGKVIFGVVTIAGFLMLVRL